MLQTLPARSEKNKTPPHDVTVSLGFLKSAIEQELDRTIPRATWSDWCRRTMGTTITARVNHPIGLFDAATLWTISGLYSYEARRYNGPAFKRLYPICLAKSKELYNV